jgi:hypothetical protein
MQTITMNAQDAIFGSLAECYITIGDRRYNMMQFYTFTSSIAINNVDVPILGQVNLGKKATGTSGTWSGTAYYNQSVIRAWMLNYHKTGVLNPFDIQVSNQDPSSQAGRQTIILRGCLTDSLVLAKFDAGNNTLDEEISGTFNTWDMPEKFNLLSGM